LCEKFCNTRSIGAASKVPVFFFFIYRKFGELFLQKLGKIVNFTPEKQEFPNIFPILWLKR
jgi:hypothetical protein